MLLGCDHDTSAPQCQYRYYDVMPVKISEAFQKLLILLGTSQDHGLLPTGNSIDSSTDDRADEIRYLDLASEL